MKPIEDLKAEHEGILLMLDVLERMSERIAAGKSVPTDHLKQVLDFLQVFADQCHHGKEERLLFSAMEAAGVPKEGGPLAVMLSEHGRGRLFTGEMRDLVELLRERGIGCSFGVHNPGAPVCEPAQEPHMERKQCLVPNGRKSGSRR